MELEIAIWDCILGLGIRIQGWDRGAFYDFGAGVDFLAFPPINIGEIYKKIFDLRKVISQSEIPFDQKQLHQLSVVL